MASRIEERPREGERVAERERRLTEEELRLEPMLSDRDYEKLYGVRAWLRDRVRLQSVFAGLFIALATEVFLIAFGIWIGLVTAPVTPTGGIPFGFAIGQAIWLIVSSWLSLLLGGWYAAHMAGVAGMMDGILNGVAVWGLYIVTSVLLGSFSALIGVGSLFSVTIGPSTLDLLRALNLSSATTVTPEQAAAIRAAVTDAATAVWVFTAVGAGFAILGGWLGARSRRVRVLPPGGEMTGPSPR